MTGWPVGTIVRGKMVMWQGELVTAPTGGRCSFGGVGGGVGVEERNFCDDVWSRDRRQCATSNDDEAARIVGGVPDRPQSSNVLRRMAKQCQCAITMLSTALYFRGKQRNHRTRQMSRIARSITLLMLILLFSTQAAVPQTESVAENVPISTCDWLTESADGANIRNLTFAPKFFLSNNTVADCESKIYATSVRLVESKKFTIKYIEVILESRFRMAVCLNFDWLDAFDEGWRASMNVYSHDNKLIWGHRNRFC